MSDKKTQENGIGKGTPGPGRPKGQPNKLTQDVREAIARIAEDNAENFAEWIGRVAAEDPGKAADLYLKAIEYHIPKLARTELTGKGGGPVVVAANAQDEQL